MIFPKAKKIARELDWYKTKNGVFGLYKGYFFNVADAALLSNPQFKSVMASTDKLTEEQKLQIKKELEANKKALKFTSFEISDNSIFFQFIESLKYTRLKTVYSLLDFLADVFKRLNIPEQNKCHSCGSKENTKPYDLNDIGIILCNSCFQKTENSFYEIEREKYSEDKNYLTGFLGSIVFSIPGIIGWVLLAVYLERLASGMAVIIALLGFKGYEYFKGRHGNLTKYIIILSNIVSILIANISTIIVMLVKEGLALSQSFAALQASEAVKKIFFQNTLISFLLAFFIWISLLIDLKNKTQRVTLAGKMKNQNHRL